MIRSYWNLGSLLTFDTARQARNIRLGYLDAMKSFGACEGIAFPLSRASSTGRLS